MMACECCSKSLGWTWIVTFIRKTFPECFGIKNSWMRRLRPRDRAVVVVQLTKRSSFPTPARARTPSHPQPRGPGSNPRPRISRLRVPNSFAVLFMLYFMAAYESYTFEREIVIQCNDLNSLAASLQKKLLGKHFQKEYLVYLNRWFKSERGHFL